MALSLDIFTTPLIVTFIYRVCRLKRDPLYNSMCKLTGDTDIAVLYSTSLSLCALLNSSRTAAKRFRNNGNGRRWTHVLLAPAERLRS
jgi:hypothetical protein